MNDQPRKRSRVISVLVLTLTLVSGYAYFAPGSRLRAVAAQNASPSGSFGFVANAYQMDSGGQNGLALVGIMNFDGAGNVSGPVIAKPRSTFGTTVPASFTGTYTSSPDGASSVTLAFDLGFPLTFAVVPTEGGQGFQLLSTDTPGATGPAFRGQGLSFSGPLPIGLLFQGATGNIPLSLTGVRGAGAGGAPLPGPGITVYTAAAATGSGTARCPDGSMGTWTASVPALTIVTNDQSGNFLATVAGTLCGRPNTMNLSGLAIFNGPTLALHVPGTVVSGIARAAQAGGSLNGAYGFQVNSWPFPAGAIGVMNFDGAGNVAISTTTHGDDPTARANFTGTYSVNPDGSGTITSPGPSFAFVITDGGSQLLLLRTDNNNDAKFSTSFGTARLQ